MEALRCCRGSRGSCLRLPTLPPLNWLAERRAHLNPFARRPQPCCRASRASRPTAIIWRPHLFTLRRPALFRVALTIGGVALICTGGYFLFQGDVETVDAEAR